MQTRRILKLTFRLIVVVLIACASLPGNLRADPVPAPIFSPHMVLQRDMLVPVWGTGNPNEKVTVSFSGKSETATVDSEGKWKLKLGPFSASANPETMTIASNDPASKPVTIEDVLVGEVWVGSGQSNMQMPANAFLGGAKTADSVLAKSPGDPNLQDLIKSGPYPAVRLMTVKWVYAHVPPVAETVWMPSNPENLASFSAQFECFGISLNKKLNVPVGLMLAAVGGTPSGEWVSRDALTSDPDYQAAVAKANQTFSIDVEQQKYTAALKKYQDDLAARNQLSPEDQRKTPWLRLKPELATRPGETSSTRLVMGQLHDRYVLPLVSYGIRGVLWDQGESGTGINAIDQPTVMAALIRSWRQEWGQSDFPFVYVQKPSGCGCAFDYGDKVMSWASDPFEPLPEKVPTDGDKRWLFIRIASNPNTFMVPTSDLGQNLHPWNKFAYGLRDCQVALGCVYGQPIEFSGPRYDSSQVEGSKIRIHFSHVGKGLTFRNGDKLQGFAVAGDDMKFVWADAAIDGQTVVVSSSTVPQPKYVRYAWSFKHPWANLFNLDGFPAICFRTDS